jgi:hypothetical protein
MQSTNQAGSYALAYRTGMKRLFDEIDNFALIRLTINITRQ